jgi:hypothetical protein
MRIIRRSEWAIWEPFAEHNVYEWFSYQRFWSTNGSHITHSDLWLVLISPILIYEWFSYHQFWSMIGSHDMRTIRRSDSLIWEPFVDQNGWYENQSSIIIVIIDHMFSQYLLKNYLPTTNHTKAIIIFVHSSSLQRFSSSDKLI